MSKKKFKAGLESLFGDVGDDQLPGIRPLLVEEEVGEGDTGTIQAKRPKKRSRKNFSSDLEDLFHNALDKDYTEPTVRNPKPKGRDTTSKKRQERPIIGIDALIRRTTSESRTEFKVNTPLRKRVTLTLEKQKLEKLKSIAKSKRAYLKDIMDEIISEYLSDHPDQELNINSN